MSQVDPFLIPIPAAFAKDPEVLAWATYLHRWCHDMWVRSGAGNDTLESVVDVIIGETPTVTVPTTTGGTTTTSGGTTTVGPTWDATKWEFFAYT